MEYSLVGWPEDGPQIRLDHREFSYAGKFVMSNTGKAVVREDEGEDGDSDGEGTDEREVETDDGSGEREVDSGRDPERDRDWVEDDRIVAAVAFNEDRTDPATAWLRYVTVREDRRGEGLGARLARFTTARLREREYDRVKIAVNNAFAYHALYKAGFGYTGEQTGLAELVLALPGDRSRERYQSGLDVYRERDRLADEERSFLAAKSHADPPERVESP
ncbi:GNAT family N-acetyltransferase [Halorussus sp. MSC15.2]|uniref:GNAT family N-acetyltransferase n=1 Tax=Halorussus sp. MSC15.2 TaxID=2283638 RepID=UPI0013D68975|nr:GNAT family N-acetyltransferase [Halorussus sp. MSC15.2]NEU57334.1 GNAT family N-acetyltransferase [Halorussus sp. MSC15.2]